MKSSIATPNGRPVLLQTILPPRRRCITRAAFAQRHTTLNQARWQGFAAGAFTVLALIGFCWWLLK